MTLHSPVTAGVSRRGLTVSACGSGDRREVSPASPAPLPRPGVPSWEEVVWTQCTHCLGTFREELGGGRQSHDMASLHIS